MATQEELLEQLIKHLQKFDKRMDNLFFPGRGDTGQQPPQPPIIRPEMPDYPDVEQPPIVVQVPEQQPEEVTAPYIYDSVYGTNPPIKDVKEIEFINPQIMGETAEYFEIKISEPGFLTMWVNSIERKIPRKIVADKWFDIKQPGVERIKIDLETAETSELQLFTSVTTPLTTLRGGPSSTVSLGGVDVDEVFDTVNYGSDTVSAAGTAEALNSGTSLSVPQGAELVVAAKEGNSGKVYVGDSSVDSTSGFPLDPKDAVGLKIADVSSVYIDVETDGDGVNWIVEAN